MIAKIEKDNKQYKVDFHQPIDISIPIGDKESSVSAWYVDPASIEPVVGEGFVGEVAQGGSVNFMNIQFNPHGNGTHTECVGHISTEKYSINSELKYFHCFCQLVTVKPEKVGQDFQITEKLLREVLHEKTESLVIRTAPNAPSDKLKKDYSNTNPPYMTVEAMEFVVSQGVDHLLIDLPSVDREVDEGKLSAHRVFWNYPTQPEKHKTITEMVYVRNEIKDGLFLLNLQIAPFNCDASPSKPVLYKAELTE